MKSLNKVMLIGRMNEIPVLNTTFSGVMVTNFPIETSEKRNDGTTHTERHNITVFGKMAEKCAILGEPGSLIYIEGKMQTKTMEIEDTVVRQSKVLAHAVKFFDIDPDDETGSDYPKKPTTASPSQRNLRRRARPANRIIPPFIRRQK